MSLTEFKYFVTFVDDFSYATWFYLMKSRSKIQTQFHVSVQTLRSDNAKEYLSEPF